MKTVYLIDDDADLSMLTKMALVKYGYRVVVFHDAKSAISQAAIDRPQLMLMDIMLPGFSGAEAVKLMGSDSKLSQIPVVFLTGLVSYEEDIGSGISIDGRAYKTLGKPYEISRLIQVVEESIHAGVDR